MTLSNFTDTSFQDFVSAEQVDDKSAMALINRAEDFKAGQTVHFPEPIYAANLFLSSHLIRHIVRFQKAKPLKTPLKRLGRSESTLR